MNKLYTWFLILIFQNYFFCQKWVQLKQNGTTNFYTIQKSFNDYWRDNDITVKSRGYKVFKRWEYHVAPRVYPSGDLSLLNKNAENFQEFLNNNSPTSSNKLINSSSQLSSTTWTLVGPLGAMTGSATNGLPRKAGRDNFVTFHPTTANTLWVGAPAGGLWKTTNNGTNWTTTTDNLSVIGCSDLAIDPTNTNIMYLATGDGDAGDTPSIGVLKSTDGGLTWNPTGLTATPNNNFLIRRLIINPTNPQILIAATNAGIRRTTNGGTSWTTINSVNSYDLEFKPSDPNTVYASGAYFYRSTDAGATFTQVTTGIATTGSNRMAVAVTTNSAGLNYVYAIASSASTNGLLGVYRSIDGGVTFTTMATTPDVLANSCAGSGTGGQGWYDLAIAASPLNANEVVVGGVNHWRSTNGGSTWTNIGCWNSTVANPPYVHADVHDLEYNSAGVLYSANDGGISYYNGTLWVDITGNRNIAQIYRIGLSAISPNYWITGHQDNGSNLYTGSAYLARYPGDGMDCFIDWNNNNNLFASTPNGGHVKSTNGGTSWTAANTGISQGGNWVTPWKQDPSVSGTIYSGRTTIWKSIDQGTSWTALGATGGTGSIIEFAIAPSNNQVIYALHSGSIRKTINGGTSWTNITSTVPLGSAAPTYVSVDATDPNTAWVTLSGYSAGNKVFMTTNGGTSWTNVSSNLPNLPTNCIVYQPGSNDRVYVGMDVGVYYKDNASVNWTLYNAGLPNTVIADLEISPAAPGLLRAATYGRGVYQVDVIPNSIPPTSAFSFSGAVCTGVSKTFNDASTNTPTSWSWSVTPSTGVTVTSPTSQNPNITFSTAGTYSVSMQATNGFGAGNISTQTLIVTATPNIILTNSLQTICSGNTVSIAATGATSYSWNTGATTSALTLTPNTTSVYTVTGSTGSCNSSKTATITVNPSPTVTITSASICAGTSTVISASGATSYSWSTGAASSSINISPTLTTVYTVTGTTGSCKNIKTTTVTVNTTPNIILTGSLQTVCSGNTTSIGATGATTYSWNTGATSAIITLTPNTTSVYTVTGANGSCTSSKTATITVNPSPTITVTSGTVCAGTGTIISVNGANTYSWSNGATSSTISVSPALTTVYTVTGTVGSCKSVKTTTVTVNNTPVLTINSPIICSGNTATLVASGATSYTWNTGAFTATINPSPTSTTIYSVTGANGNCYSNKTTTVYVNNTPNVNASASSSIICLGQSVILSATGANSYTWQPGNAIGATFSTSPISTQIYSVTGSATNGCAKSNTLLVNVSPCTGITNLNGTEIEYSVFPNPAKDQLTLKINTLKNLDVSFEIIDNSGKIILKQNLKFDKNKTESQINISSVSSGIYFLKLYDKNETIQTIKLIKE